MSRSFTGPSLNRARPSTSLPRRWWITGFPPVPLPSLLQQRIAWGRLFGFIRARRMSSAERLVLALLAPLVPLRLLLRHGMVEGRKGRLGRYLLAAPAILLLRAFWTWGEAAGYVRQRP